jgi:hypothetical protein
MSQNNALTNESVSRIDLYHDLNTDIFLLPPLDPFPFRHHPTGGRISCFPKADGGTAGNKIRGILEVISQIRPNNNSRSVLFNNPFSAIIFILICRYQFDPPW